MTDYPIEGKRIVVGVQIIVRHGAKILLGLRKNAFQAGTWGLPGGYLGINQTLLEAAVKELKEETGLVASKLRLFCVTDPLPASNHHMQIGVEALVYDGELEVKEPEKCEALIFYPLDNLPKPLFISSVEVINNYRSGKFYSETVLDALCADGAQRG
jgi:8-oxo-dGTP diphosphatase